MGNQEINNILIEGENIKWEGKISAKIIKIIYFVCGIIVLCISAYFFSKGTDPIILTNDSGKNIDVTKYISTYMIGVIVLIIGFILTYIYYLYLSIQLFLTTNKRIIIQSGIIGTDFKSIYFDQIKNIDVKVDFIGLIFKVGNILIDTGKIGTKVHKGNKNRNTYTTTRTIYDKFMWIDKPYEVFKFLQEGLSSRKESIHSGRADFEGNEKEYKEYIKKTEEFKK